MLVSVTSFIFQFPKLNVLEIVRVEEFYTQETFIISFFIYSMPCQLI